MDEIVAAKESVHNILKKDRFTFCKFKSVCSYDIKSGDTLNKFFELMDFRELLIGIEVSTFCLNDLKIIVSNSKKSRIEINKGTKYGEAVLSRNVMAGNKQISDFIFMSAQTNDFLFMVINPDPQVKYYDPSCQKVKIDLQSGEKVLFFDFDADPLFVLS